MLLMNISLFYMLNYTDVRPHAEPLRYKLEQFNEISILMITYVVTLFFRVPDELLYSVGYIHVGLMVMVVTVNVTVIIAKSVK